MVKKRFGGLNYIKNIPGKKKKEFSEVNTPNVKWKTDDILNIENRDFVDKIFASIKENPSILKRLRLINKETWKREKLNPTTFSWWIWIDISYYEVDWEKKEKKSYYIYWSLLNKDFTICKVIIKGKNLLNISKLIKK